MNLSGIIAAVVFAVIGWLAFRKSVRPRKGWVWLVLIATTLLAGYIGINSKLLSFLGFNIYLNDCLQGLGFGVLVGLLARKD